MTPKHLENTTKGDGLVKSDRSTLYYDYGDQALYKITDIYLLGYEWVLLWSYENDSDNDFSKKVTTTTTLRVRTGEETAKSFKVSAEFSKMGFTAKAEAGIEHKTFTEEETTSSTTREVEYKVKAHSSVFVYQKVYKFAATVWFKQDANHQYSTVGKWERDGVAEVTSEITISANEFAQTGTALTGKGDLVVETVKSADTKTNVKRFEHCTSRCQSYLHARGV